MNKYYVSFGKNYKSETDEILINSGCENSMLTYSKKVTNTRKRMEHSMVEKKCEEPSSPRMLDIMKIWSFEKIKSFILFRMKMVINT